MERQHTERQPVVNSLPQLTREEALAIRDQVNLKFGDLSKELKTIIAERLVLLTRKLKDAQARLKKNPRDEQAQKDEFDYAFILIDPLTTSMIGQIEIEREQRRFNELIKLLEEMGL
jgi:hypothetical protein